MSNTLTRKQWAARIKQAWLSTVEGIFTTGAALSAAKKELEHGEFEAMVEKDLPFGPRSAQMLMAIAADERLTKAKHVSLLPPHWGTLYALTRLPDDTLAEKLKDGTVHCEMERSDVQLLLNRITRAERFKEMKSAPLPEGKVEVLYIDPPWQFKTWSESSAYGAALEHYPTMPIEDICALPMGECATEHAVLFMWATAATLTQATVDVLPAWGFNYKTGMVWDKEVQGMGYFVRNQHEHLLIATRGDIPTPDPNDKPVSVIRARRGKHSAKPHVVYEFIERMYPQLRKREFFARHWRRGWEKPWGNVELAEMKEDTQAVAS